MARGGLGHVKACPADGQPCPCLPGSVSEAHCYVDAKSLCDESKCSKPCEKCDKGGTKEGNDW